MLNDRLKNQIMLEIRQITELFEQYRELIENSRDKEPDLIERTALASVLHSFYTGLESVFEEIASRIDGSAPTGQRWHADLLTQMASPVKSRGAVIADETRKELQKYLAFRHYYRHGYSYTLSWLEMKELVEGLENIWFQARGEIEAFLQDMEATCG